MGFTAVTATAFHRPIPPEVAEGPTHVGRREVELGGEPRGALRGAKSREHPASLAGGQEHVQGVPVEGRGHTTTSDSDLSGFRPWITVRSAEMECGVLGHPHPGWA